jgi:hypothetical protein
MIEPGLLPLLVRCPSLGGAGHAAVSATLVRHGMAAIGLVSAADAAAVGLLLDEPLAPLTVTPDVDSALAAMLDTAPWWAPEARSLASVARPAPAVGMVAPPGGAAVERPGRTSPGGTSTDGGLSHRSPDAPAGVPLLRGQPRLGNVTAVGLDDQVGRILHRARRPGPVGTDRAMPTTRDTSSSPPPAAGPGDQADAPPTRARPVSSAGSLAELVARWEGRAGSGARTEIAPAPAGTESFGGASERLLASEAGSSTPDAVRELQPVLSCPDLGDAFGAVLAREARRHGIEVARG